MPLKNTTEEKEQKQNRQGKKNGEATFCERSLPFKPACLKSLHTNVLV